MLTVLTTKVACATKGIWLAILTRACALSIAAYLTYNLKYIEDDQ